MKNLDEALQELEEEVRKHVSYYFEYTKRRDRLGCEKFYTVNINGRRVESMY
jgi:hypothetical protein